MSPRDDDRTKRLDTKELLLKAQEDSPPVAATLTCLSGPQQGSVYVLRQGTNIIGRSESAIVRIRAAGVSRKHAKIVEKDGKYLLSDMGSTNGTICGDTVIETPTPLSHGDRIIVGTGVVLRFSLVDALEEQANAALFEQATRDGLTAAHNRRYFEDRLDSEWPWASRHARPCALVLLDLDHFKSINDTHGHPAGDFVLREFVQVARAQFRREDLFARVGGEEFVLLCRDTDTPSAAVVAERLRHAVANHDFVWKGIQIPVTVSAGVAISTEPKVNTADELMELADRRLYRAKALGRNRVVTTDEPAEE